MKGQGGPVLLERALCGGGGGGGGLRVGQSHLLRSHTASRLLARIGRPRGSCAAGSARGQHVRAGGGAEQTKEEEEEEEARLLARLRALHAPPAADSPLPSLLETTTKGSEAERLRGLIDLRAVLLQAPKKAILGSEDQQVRDELRTVAAGLRNVLAERFEPQHLVLKQIERTSSSSILRKVVETESVHPLKSIDEFKARLGKGRKCYAFFHPLLPEEPLVYINVAFEPRVARSMREIYLDDEKRVREEDANAAVFYSIVTTQPGLRGVDLPHQLIEFTARYLHQHYPGLTEFSTLSPIPGFMPWLRLSLTSATRPALFDRKVWLEDVLSTTLDVLKKELGVSSSLQPQQTLMETLDHNQWFTNERVVAALQPLMLRLCAHYIVNERAHNGSTRALDRVANFHLGNGAHVRDINWMADLMPLRLSESASLMVNYEYPHPSRPSDAGNADAYLKEGIIKVSANVETLLRDRW